MTEIANLGRYRRDIESLVKRGEGLRLSLAIEFKPELSKKIRKEALERLPDFKQDYQTWYSEALRAVAQLLPDREHDFMSFYKPLRARRDLNNENYTISDYLKGLSRKHITGDYTADPSCAYSSFEQQLNLVHSIKARFESSLFDIRSLVQADLFDNELDAAEDLNNKGFHRGAGAIAGVVLEGHLGVVCGNHKITMPRNPSISKLNDLLKDGNVVDVPGWRFIQHLGDLRNLCDHKRGPDPSKEQIQDLLDGTRKVIKTVF